MILTQYGLFTFLFALSVIWHYGSLLVPEQVLNFRIAYAISTEQSFL